VAIGEYVMKKCLITPQYKFNEGDLLDQFRDYVNSTYDSHYSKDKFQATEFVIDGGHGTGFCVGNVLKYAQRYGKKGSPEDHRKDLMKVLHYALIQLYIHDEENISNLDDSRVSPSFLTENDYPEYDPKMAPGHHSRLNDVTPEEWDSVSGYSPRIKGVSLSG
jgi:hypothetical protein